MYLFAIYQRICVHVSIRFQVMLTMHIYGRIIESYSPCRLCLFHGYDDLAALGDTNE